MNCVVLTIHWEQGHTGAFYSGHHDFACSDEDFFIGKRDVFSELNGFVSSGKADDADCGGDYNLRVGMGGDALHSLRTK